MKEIVYDLFPNISTKIKYKDDMAWAPMVNVLQGEYDVRAEFDFPPTILDIGANIGTFAIWAIRRFKPEDIYCYEPIKSTYKLLEENIRNLPKLPFRLDLSLINKAVQPPNHSNKMYLGVQDGGSSFYEVPQSTTEEYEIVETIEAKDLPECDILKVDTEGCEIEIIQNYLIHHTSPSIIMFEYHRDKDRKILDTILGHYEYNLSGGHVFGYGLGVFRYIHQHAPILTQVEFGHNL